MTVTAELTKIRTHRTPWATAAVLGAAVLAPSAVLLFYTPTDTTAYSGAFTATYQLFAPLMAVVFGGWLLGTEYRQGTLKRLLASEPRRLRALGAKAAVGAVALSVTLAVAATVGWAAARVVGELNDVVIAWNGRELLAAGLWAIAAAAIAFCVSAIARSDAFAMVGTVGLMLVLDPLISLIPTVGKYSVGVAIGDLTQRVAGGVPDVPTQLGVGTAAVTLTLWMAAFIGAGSFLFSRRDV